MRRAGAAVRDGLRLVAGLLALGRRATGAEPVALVVLYHRIAPRAGDPARELVPAVSERTFRRQLRWLRLAFRLVPAGEVLDAARARRRLRRVPLAVTFDDESRDHVRSALPELRRAGVRATFFLTGATGPMWWELVQAVADTDDVHAQAERLKRLPPNERDAAVKELGRLGVEPAEGGMSADDLRALAAEQDVGFHTRRHDLLPALDDEGLTRAMSDGRRELESAAGRPLALLAYPHGAAGAREAVAARRAGFRLAFTTDHHPCGPATDPHLVGRIEVGEAGPGSMLRQLAQALRAGEPRLRVDPERERAELAAYLGEDYDEDHLRRYHEHLEDELREIGDEATLYRESKAYLYNLTAFAMTGTKVPYLDELVRALPPGSRILDYGCGIGSDGLLLLEAGYDVAFADFDNPSTRYLRWRLDRRGFDAPVYDLDREQPPDDFDLAYSFDVIEHVDDPYAFLDRLERHARHVLVNFLEPEPGETELHHELPVGELLRRCATRELLRYRVLHGRSHLVLYRSRRARGPARARALAMLGRGRLARP